MSVKECVTECVGRRGRAGVRRNCSSSVRKCMREVVLESVSVVILYKNE